MREPIRGEISREKEELVLKFREVMRVVEAYNKKHNIGAMMASAFAGEDQLQILEEGRRNALSDAIQAREVVSGFGLELGFGSNINISMFEAIESGDEKVVHPPEISMGIENPDLFVDFLRRIEKVDFEKYPDLKKDILTIIKYTSRQIADPDSTEDRIASLVSVGTKILHEFDRLGFGKDIENLSESLVNAQGGTLNELRALRAVKCLEKPDARVFGPSDWHKDMLIEEYKRRWSETKRVVLDTLQNKNAIMLARKAMENLIANADYAIKNMEEKIVSSPDMTEGYKRAQLEYVKTCQEYKAVYEDLLSKVEEPELN